MLTWKYHWAMYSFILCSVEIIVYDYWVEECDVPILPFLFVRRPWSVWARLASFARPVERDPECCLLFQSTSSSSFFRSEPFNRCCLVGLCYLRSFECFCLSTTSVMKALSLRGRGEIQDFVLIKERIIEQCLFIILVHVLVFPLFSHTSAQVGRSDGHTHFLFTELRSTRILPSFSPTPVHPLAQANCLFVCAIDWSSSARYCDKNESEATPSTSSWP